jgi:Transglycosylase SLT domain
MESLRMAVPYLACMAMVASFYHLPPRVLPAIQAVEGGAVGSVHRNADASEDYGVMQVNTRWIVPLARVTRMSPEAVRVRLIMDPCFNIAAAGAILRQYLVETHGDLLGAIGFYHSHSIPLGRRYREQVMRSAAIMFGAPRQVARP